MRFFIALELSDKNSSQVEQIQQHLSHLIPNIRLTDPEKLHLTLAFIGEQPDYFQDKITQVLEESAKGIPPFTVTPSYLDGFPNIHSPHVVWLGVKGDVDKLQILRERIKDGLINLKLVVDERRFSPHITVGKLPATHVSKKIEAHLQEIVNYPMDPIEVKLIKLFKSEANQSFHTHTVLSEVKLS